MNKKELKEALDAAGITYDEQATNDELKALLPKEPVEEPVEEPVVPEVSSALTVDGLIHPKYGKLTPFQFNYFKQNPTKFEKRMDNGEVPKEAPTRATI